MKNKRCQTSNLVFMGTLVVYSIGYTHVDSLSKNKKRNLSYHNFEIG